MRMLWFALPLGLAAAQCGGIARTEGGDLCLAGQRIECACGRAKGVRTCTAEGIGYGECVCSGGTGGGTIDDDGGPPVESCTSKSAWMSGLQGSAAMTPGRACMACHAMTPRAPQYTVAGTIYPNSGRHDADDCNGADGLGVAVAMLADDGSELGPRLQVNHVGNFFTNRPMPARYRVKVIAAGKESAMQAPVTNGDCNVCHTQSGTLGASGRMVTP
jgi:hypothetical protein